VSRIRFPIIALCAAVATVVVTGNAIAYIGPGAGMEFFGYAIGLLSLVGVALLGVLMWPFQTFMRWLRHSKPPIAIEQSTDARSESNDSPKAPCEIADAAPKDSATSSVS
jgi:hypothetical protein